ncbi:hypothetical protein ESCO_001613 [Escovopsis weberi]|uniref:Tim44-like domain-containing protein n=1 Tax=Escovopsis weberi TaxID=150374 RepID=A0A0M9VWA2_ESCWE|nr:hypothetical protein ESCO_001613 [Escovopsis weberi]
MSAPARAAPLAAPALRYATSRPNLPRPAVAQIFRNYSLKAKLTRENQRSTRAIEARMGREASMSQLEKTAHAEYFKDGGGPLFPGTFISLPLSAVPRGPGSFALYQWSRLKNWGIEALSVLNFKLKSMPNWTTRPKWKARRGKIAPTAKGMYQEMLEAFAAGDKLAIQRLCVGEFGSKLIAAIERRDPRERVRFEVTKHNGWPFYPRLKSHQIHQVNPYDKASVTEQAVVAVSSTQQVSRHSALTGGTIPGSVKIQDKIEYVVLSRQANSNTFESGNWRIWGTTSATTLEGYLEMQDAIEKEQAKRAGWKTASK